MSVAPLPPPSEASSTTAREVRGNSRPKRIQPPAHWKTEAKPAISKAAANKSLVPVNIPASIPAHTPRMPSARFIITLALCVTALNAALLFLFPLPSITKRINTPVFSVAPEAEPSELPIWLRS